MVKTVHAQVPPGATTLDIMQALHKKKKIPIHEMQLWHDNTVLAENQLLSFYGIRDGTNLTLKTMARSGECVCSECWRSKQRITVTVTWLTKSTQVECVMGEPVEALKKAIQKAEGIAVSRQKLTFKGQVMDNHKLLSTFKLDDEERGNVVPVVHMFVDNGTPSVLAKLCNALSFRSSHPTAAAPAPAPVAL